MSAMSGLQTAVLSVPADSLSVGAHTFIVTVGAANAPTARTASVVVTVVAAGSTAPLLNIQAPASCNAQQPLSITSTVLPLTATPASAFSYKWQELLHQLPVESQSILNAPANSGSLVIKPSVLVSGLTYHFQLTVTSAHHSLHQVC